MKKLMIIAVAVCGAFYACSRPADTGVNAEAAAPVQNVPSVTANGAGVMLGHYSTRNFAAGAVPEADLDSILQTGIRSPSAANRQPWHFTVVRDLELAKKIIPQTVEGNVVIVVSAEGDGRTNTREVIDCSLAVQSMYLAAQALGYGSRIYTGPIANLNRNLKGDLGISDDSNAVVILRIGKFDTGADAVSGASARNPADSMITYK
jgi:nitroreductase